MLITTATETSLELKPRHAFYRVVAIDAHSFKSGSSDVLPAKRPWIFSEPAKEAKVGSEFHEVRTIHSIGDLRCRAIGAEQYNAAYWDAEKPQFTMAQGPAWLKIDTATGVLIGTPSSEGEIDVHVAVETPDIGPTNSRSACAASQTSQDDKQ